MIEFGVFTSSLIRVLPGTKQTRRILELLQGDDLEGKKGQENSPRQLPWQHKSLIGLEAPRVTDRSGKPYKSQMRRKGGLYVLTEHKVPGFTWPATSFLKCVPSSSSYGLIVVARISFGEAYAHACVLYSLPSYLLPPFLRTSK